MDAVVLLGPPGAGKGTVAEVLEEKGYTHVSTGELLREQIRLQTELGLEAQKLINHGHFVSDEVVVGMIRALMASSDSSVKFLFDGFPRTLTQAEKMDELVAEFQINLNHVVLLECPNDAIVERLVGRRTCEKCGAVYHVKFNPPSQDDACDQEGCELVQRPDDTEETVRERLSVYHERTEPLIAYYSEKKLIRKVNANQPIAQVQADAVATLY